MALSAEQKRVMGTILSYFNYAPDVVDAILNQRTLSEGDTIKFALSAEQRLQRVAFTAQPVIATRAILDNLDVGFQQAIKDARKMLDALEENEKEKP